MQSIFRGYTRQGAHLLVLSKQRVSFVLDELLHVCIGERQIHSKQIATGPHVHFRRLGHHLIRR
mgnify:CR=1 FL=1